RLIVDIHLNKLLKRAKNLGYSIVVDDSAKDWFVDEIFTSKFGVRALKRLIQEQVENRLSFLIMQEKVKPGQEVFLNVHPSGRRLQIYTKTVQTTVREEIAPVEFPNEPNDEETSQETEQIPTSVESEKITEQPQMSEDNDTMTSSDLTEAQSESNQVPPQMPMAE
ncbi:MAG: hypothetical protein J6V11_00615, partial [Alphaproteobacteria bacterium]|nr:hypothetical protein [Alphaproteobacteria bacterium]